MDMMSMSRYVFSVNIALPGVCVGDFVIFVTRQNCEQSREQVNVYMLHPRVIGCEGVCRGKSE